MSRLDVALEPTERHLAARDTTLWRKLADSLAAKCHPDQRAFVLDVSRYIAALVGRGGGKTTGGVYRFIRCMLLRRASRCLFIARTRDHARVLIWDDFKRELAQLGFVDGGDVIYNESLLTATLTRNGSTLKLGGADKLADLEQYRGKTYHEIGIDEAASHPDHLLSYFIHEIVGPRLVGALWLIGTAGRRLKGYFYDRTRRGSTLSVLWQERAARPGWQGWSLHRWSLKSAIDATGDRPIAALLELYESQLLELATLGWSEDNPARRREYDAEWASDNTANVYQYRIHNEHGALWNQWDPERIGPLGMAKLPTQFRDWIHIVAMDPGYTDPTAINLFSISPSDPTRTLYHRLCFEQTELRPSLVAQLLLGAELTIARPGGIIGAIGEWPNTMVADMAHQMAQALLDELAQFGIHFEPAAKGFRYKVGAINIVNADFFEGRIKVLKDSQLEEQLIDLQWDESATTGEQIERKGAPNHSADCLVYARMVQQQFISALPGAPPTKAPAHPHDPSYVPPMPHEVRDEYSALMGDEPYAGW